ncbi:MAG: hypothetical protein ABH986_05770 [archaeon]
MISEFLVALIVSLLFGNGLLYFTSRTKESDSLLSLKEKISGSGPEVSATETDLSVVVPEAYIDDIYSVQASLRGVNEKLKLTHERISELETTINSINSVLVSGNETGLSTKVKKLDDFKRNALIELEAIKKLLKQLKEFREIKDKKSLSAKKKEQEINKRIHELVFNTTKKN